MTLTTFIQKWTHPDYQPESVSAEALREVEQHFQLLLPEAYKCAVLMYGLPRPTISLLHSIVEQNLDVHNVTNFYAPHEIISQTEGWRKAGMPKDLIAFASDGSGNNHCFRLGDDVLASQVWFFDHDFVEVELEAQDFDAWIESYCVINPVPWE
ncbi:MAG: SMI1/KNR4 family protein [Rhizomicrobium sp.]